MAERPADELDNSAPQQATVTMNSDPINRQVVLPIFVLICSSWYPYAKQVNIFFPRRGLLSKLIAYDSLSLLPMS